MRYLKITLTLISVIFGNYVLAQGELEFNDVLNQKDIVSMDVKEVKRSENRYGKITENITVTRYEHVNNSKKLLIVQKKEGNNITEYSYIIDKDGKVEQVQNSYNNNLGNIISYEYDENGRVTKHIKYSKNKQLEYSKFNYYSSEGLLVKDSSNFYRQNNLAYHAIVKYKYEDQKLIKKDNYHSQSPSSTEKYEYDALNRLTSEYYFKSNGSLYGKWENKYTDDNFISERYVSGAGKSHKRILYSNSIKVDKEGNWIELVRKGTFGKTIYRTIIYK